MVVVKTPLTGELWCFVFVNGNIAFISGGILFPGNSNSAGDIAVEVSKYAEKVCVIQ